jgi:hypothetical protein
VGGGGSVCIQCTPHHPTTRGDQTLRSLHTHYKIGARGGEGCRGLLTLRLPAMLVAGLFWRCCGAKLFVRGSNLNPALTMPMPPPPPPPPPPPGPVPAVAVDIPAHQPYPVGPLSAPVQQQQVLSNVVGRQGLKGRLGPVHSIFILPYQVTLLAGEI